MDINNKQLSKPKNCIILLIIGIFYLLRFSVKGMVFILFQFRHTSLIITDYDNSSSIYKEKYDQGISSSSNACYAVV